MDTKVARLTAGWQSLPKVFICPNFLYEKKMFKSVVDEEGDEALVSAHLKLIFLFKLLMKIGT